MLLIAKPGPIIQGSYRVFRGGSWFSVGRFCRSADRNWCGPTYWDYLLGFRVALRKKTP